MLASIPIRPLIARWRGWLPLAVLLAALASAIALGGGDRGYFYRESGIHNQMTAKNLAVAGNMSPKHSFRLATAVWRDESGGFEYDLYGRFPVGGYVLIKLAISPFGGDLAAALLAARALMLMFFCGAAIFAYLALARIAGSRWIALAATSLAFSSLYPLHYADAVGGESAMDLFGIALVFHGMVLFVQEGRFRQLLFKACAALLLGWHVYALILPFALLSFGGEALALVRSASASGGGARAALAGLPALARSRFIALAAAAILFGSALLGFNFVNEYTARGGSRGLQNLPSLDSMMSRLGLNDRYENSQDWTPGAFARRQLHRAGVASAPYAVARVASAPYEVAEVAARSKGLADFLTPAAERESPSPAWAAWGVAAALAALAAALIVPRRFRLPMASLVLAGFVWALAARGNAYDDGHFYEGMFYIGLPLALWSGALIGARRLMGGRLGGSLAIAAAAFAATALALSAFYAARIRWDEFAANYSKEIAADMDAIREVAGGKSVILSSPAWHAAARYYDLANFPRYYGPASFPVKHYLSGSYVWEGAELDSRGGGAAWASAWRNYGEGAKPDSLGADAEYAVLRYRNESAGLLTPGNRRLFLYESADLAGLLRAERRRLAASEPAARSVFDVYLEEGALRYLKSPCAPEDADADADARFFFAHFFPPDSAYLRGDAGPIGFDGVNFPFAASNNDFDSSGVYFNDACMTTVNVPYYPIAAIRTGQYTIGGGRLWEAAIFPPPSAETLAAYEMAYQAVAGGGAPAARSGFDIYLNGNDTISYLKQPCSEEDARGRFFLSVHPADAADLPAERREIGHESLNFSFEPPRGVVFNGKCMTTRQLPDYEIAKVETGQWVPGGERLWDAVVDVGD